MTGTQSSIGRGNLLSSNNHRRFSSARWQTDTDVSSSAVLFSGKTILYKQMNGKSYKWRVNTPHYAIQGSWLTVKIQCVLLFCGDCVRDWTTDSQTTWFVLIIASCIARLPYTCRLWSRHYIKLFPRILRAASRQLGASQCQFVALDRFPDFRFELGSHLTITSLIGPTRSARPRSQRCFCYCRKRGASAHTHSLILTTPVGGRRYSELKERERARTPQKLLWRHMWRWTRSLERNVVVVEADEQNLKILK